MIAQADIKYLLILSFVVVTCSCGSGLKTSKRNVRTIPANYSASISNYPYHIKHGDRSTLLNRFEIYDSAQSPVSLSFNNKSELVFTYITDGKPKTRTFQGKFKRRGYYQVYLRNKRIEIPPLLPIFYSQVDVKRLRLILTPANDLLVDDTWQRTGNIFILAGGGSGRTQSVFKTERSLMPE